MSRLAFIRQAIVARLQTFQSHERAVLEKVLGPSTDYENDSSWTGRFGGQKEI
jgi:hypothetical protein